MQNFLYGIVIFLEIQFNTIVFRELKRTGHNVFLRAQLTEEIPVQAVVAAVGRFTALHSSIVSSKSRSANIF